MAPWRGGCSWLACPMVAAAIIRRRLAGIPRGWLIHRRGRPENANASDAPKYFRTMRRPRELRRQVAAGPVPEVAPVHPQKAFTDVIDEATKGDQHGNPGFRPV